MQKSNIIFPFLLKLLLTSLLSPNSHMLPDPLSLALVILDFQFPIFLVYLSYGLFRFKYVYRTHLVFFPRLLQSMQCNYHDHEFIGLKSTTFLFNFALILQPTPFFTLIHLYTPEQLFLSVLFLPSISNLYSLISFNVFILHIILTSTNRIIIFPMAVLNTNITFTAIPAC